MKKHLTAAVLAISAIAGTAQGNTSVLPQWDRIEPLLHCAALATRFSFEEQQRLSVRPGTL